MKRYTLAVAIVAAALTVGCISSDTLVKLNADGSGTIEERMMMSTQALNMLQSMGGEEGKKADPFSVEELKKKADQMGEGVRFVSAEPIEANGMKGSKVIYAFDDINAIKMKSSGAMPAGGGEASVNAGEGDFGFKFSRTGGAPTLTITIPDDRSKKAGAGAGEAETPPETPKQPGMPPEAMNMMKMMMKGLHINISVEVNGTITKTNATYRTGNEVTLIDLNFDELMNDPEALQAMQGGMGPGSDPAAVKKALEKIKGVKIETEPVVTIQWR